MLMRWPFEDLVPLSYGLIMADPPWRFKNRSPKGEAKNAVAEYRCMTLEEIKAMPVSHLAAPNCLLWLWAIPSLHDRAFEVLRAWHFQFKTSGHWNKRTTHGKLCFGKGYILRDAGEPFLLGAIGSPKYTHSVRNTFDGLRREHSRKPVEAFEAAERLVPNVRRCELFSRETRPGWDVWGDEVGKFDEVTP